jgi:hypothetical protein
MTSSTPYLTSPAGGAESTSDQLVINRVGHLEPLARFWAEALGYVPEPPPADFATWDDWRRDIGLPESWLDRGTDCIIDPDGAGPRIWIQVVPDPKDH